MILKNLVEKAGGVCHQVSCIKSGPEGREELLAACETLLPEAPAPLYDSELFTTENMRELAAEIIREKCFQNLTHELPYQMAVQIRKFDEQAKPCPHIYADVIVGKESHKPIVIGQKAQIIKKISQESRQEIEKLMAEKIYLELNVVVRETWYEKAQLMKELGYVIHEDK
jgi:GTP-binding protein Era